MSTPTLTAREQRIIDGHLHRCETDGVKPAEAHDNYLKFMQATAIRLSLGPAPDGPTPAQLQKIADDKASLAAEEKAAGQS